jgi:hypothetical protein
MIWEEIAGHNWTSLIERVNSALECLHSQKTANISLCSLPEWSPSNIRLGWKVLEVINTLIYYILTLITAPKRFILQPIGFCCPILASGVNVIKLFCS